MKTAVKPPVLGVIDDAGILTIKRYHKAATVIGGAEITVTCDQCNSSVVLEIKVARPVLPNITGTISIDQGNISYFWAN